MQTPLYLVENNNSEENHQGTLSDSVTQTEPGSRTLAVRSLHHLDFLGVLGPPFFLGVTGFFSHSLHTQRPEVERTQQNTCSNLSGNTTGLLRQAGS